MTEVYAMVFEDRIKGLNFYDHGVSKIYTTKEKAKKAIEDHKKHMKELYPGLTVTERETQFTGTRWTFIFPDEQVIEFYIKTYNLDEGM